jgi:sortase A
MLTNIATTLGRALVIAGALVLACWVYSRLIDLLLQRAASDLLERQVRHAGSEIVRLAAPRDHVLMQPLTGDVIGRLEISRIHVSVIVLEGSNSRVLHIGAGHVHGTAFPGMMGNIAIAAHRDTFFRPVREIQPNDLITLTTPEGVFQYRVEGTEIVDPDDVQVLHHTRDAELTLVTCYPFYYVGAAPKRFIVHAKAA